MLKKRKASILVAILIMAIGVLSSLSVIAAGNLFKIKKVDQNKEPIEGVEFEVYGKPELGSKVRITKELMFPSIDVDPADIEKELIAYYIERDITIKVEGVDNDYTGTFTATEDKSYEEFVLAPGTYKVSEAMPDISGLGIIEPEFNRVQSYLESFEIVVSDEGKLQHLGGQPKWKWLKYEITLDDNTVDQIPSFEWYDDAPNLDMTFEDVQVKGNNLLITNYAYRPQDSGDPDPIQPPPEQQE